MGSATDFRDQYHAFRAPMNPGLSHNCVRVAWAMDSENQLKVSAKRANLSNTAASGRCSGPDHLYTLDLAGGTGDIQAPGLQFRKLLRVIRSCLNLRIYKAAKPSLHATLRPSLSFFGDNPSRDYGISGPRLIIVRNLMGETTLADNLSRGESLGSK